MLAPQSKSGIVTGKGTPRFKRNAHTKFLINGIMAPILFIFLFISINIFQLLAQDLKCIDDVEHNQQCSSRYLSIQDDPKYKLTVEQLVKMTFVELHQHLDCYGHAKNQSKPFYTEEMYIHMKSKYSELTGYQFPTLGQQQNVFHIAASDDAGRGIFASRDIKEGEIIPFHETCSVVTFTNGTVWKEYIVSLPRTMGCDVMEWTWTQNYKTMGDIRLCLSIGNGDSFLNNADVDEDINIKPVDETSMKFVAVKNIEKGEELIYDYELFEPTEYERFGLGSL